MFLNQISKLDDLEFMVTALTVPLVVALEPTKAQIMWILYDLAQNPEAYKQLREEVLAKKASDAKHFDLANYPFMEACVAESTRMHPAFEGLADTSMAKEDFELHGRKLPKGTVIVGMRKLAMENAMEEPQRLQTMATPGTLMAVT